MMTDYEGLIYQEAAEPESGTPEAFEAPCASASKRKGGFAVLLTQSVVCLLLLGAALAVKAVGGDLAESCRQSLGAAMGDNRVVEWIFGAWSDGSDEPSAESSEPPADMQTTAPAPTVSGSETAAPLPFVSDFVGASAVYKAAVEPAEQTAAVRRELPLPPCLPLMSGVMTSVYGEREHPISGEDSFHTGWDIAAEEGTPLAAMYDATVTEIGSGGSYGNYVQMRVSDRLSFLYAHCSQVLVSEGDRVRAGETVALVGSTGVSTGNHLHLEVLVDGESCDPSAVLSREVYPF
ncbi:MAG: M23 family metallopeptidase [Clostridia bacterium]|nr:M23 family metallopeptidase [Clostridia bacterium]